MKQKYDGRIVFISLTIEQDDTPEKIAAKFPKGLHYARGSMDAWTSLLRMGGTKTQSIPTHALIQANGSLVRTVEGSRGLEEAVAELAP